MAATVQEILESLGYKPKDFGSYYRMAALYREGTNAMSLCVRKRDGIFKDFGSKQGGSFKKLLELTLGNKPEVINKYLEDVETAAAEYIPKQSIPQEKTYPDSVLLSLLPHWDMYVKGGVSTDTLRLFKIGLAQKGKMLRRYVFPVYNSAKELIGFAGRWHKKEPESDTIPKWKLLGDKRTWLWPLHLNKHIIEEAEEVILVESPNCVIHMWDAKIQNVLCLFGTDLSPRLLKYLLSLSKLKRIVIATNNEPDNVDKYTKEGIGNKAAKDIQKKLLKWFDSERVIISLPTDKDFGVMSTEQIQTWHKNIDEPAKVDSFSL